MAQKLYRALVGLSYPASKADYELARKGDLERVTWARHEVDDEPFAAPYREIVASWLANHSV